MFRVIILAKKILVACCGNRLMRDDGVGSFIAERLLRMNLGDDVTVIDYGIAGFKLFNDIVDYDYVIFVDTVDTADSKPGTIVRFKIDPQDISVANSEDSQKLFQLSFHEIDIESVLSLCKAIGELPKKIILLGIVPKDISPGIGLSKELALRFMDLVNLVIKEIKNLRDKAD